MVENYFRALSPAICQNKVLVDLRAIGEDSFLQMSGTLPDLFQVTLLDSRTLVSKSMQ